ncbi:hypothetical protein O3M35_000468 [Rhynocoris fuscipes]|uniref:Uncharacterized protein n=1 Tax=Rhynocoris fuscipes TaxID=488301 RepID=A0AAW1DNQ3_9HEMI
MEFKSNLQIIRFIKPHLQHTVIILLTNVLFLIATILCHKHLPANCLTLACIEIIL